MLHFKHLMVLVVAVAVESSIATAQPSGSAAPAAPAEFYFPATGARTAPNALLLAIDDASLPMVQNLCYYLSKPKVRHEPVLTPDAKNPAAPDHLAVHFYGTVLHDGGKYRMWYSASHSGLNPDLTAEQRAQLGRNPAPVFSGPLCYAESDDGLKWTRPNLGQMLFKGSRANNALELPLAWVVGACVVRDAGERDPARRYKLVHNYYSVAKGATEGENSGTLASATSPDGLRWAAGQRRLVPSFIEHASLYQFGGLYIVNGQKISAFAPGQGGSDRGRQGFVHVSSDFRTWLPEHAESFALPDPQDLAKRNVNAAYDQVHLGVGATSFGNVLVGLYGLWHNADFTQQFENISCDLGLVVSNDGLHFREPVKGHVYLSQHDSPATPVAGNKYKTILCQANGILNVGDETRIYHGRWRNVEFRYTGNKYENYYGEVALATLPRDRWGALGLFRNKKHGSLWSAPVRLPAGARLRITLNAEAADAMKVELATADFQRHARFSGASIGTVSQKSGLDCRVGWKDDLAQLAGQTVRLHVLVDKADSREPRLFAINLHADPIER